MRGANGMMDLKKWECGVPGKEKTNWEGGLFKLEVTFPEGAFSQLPSSPSLMFVCLLANNRIQSTPRSRRNVVPTPRHLQLAYPNLTKRRQIHAPALPPERLPLRHRLPIYPERGGRLEARYHHQRDPPWNPVLARRAEPRVPRTSRCLQPVQERQGRV